MTRPARTEQAVRADLAAAYRLAAVVLNFFNGAKGDEARVELLLATVYGVLHAPATSLAP